MKHLYILLSFFFFVNFSFSSSYKLLPDSIKEENKTKNYTISVEYLKMDGFKDKSTQEDFNQYVSDMVKKSVNDFKKEMIGWVSNIDAQSEFDIGTTIFLQDEKIVSIRFDGYQYYSGAAHPTTFFFSVNYNLADNEPVTFSSLFKGDYLSRISSLCIKDLIRQAKEYAPENTDYTAIKEGAGPRDDNFEVFNLMPDTLHITFPVYQVASYAEGPKEVDIPYKDIMSIIDKKGPVGYLIK
jgi:hypothetical protein